MIYPDVIHKKRLTVKLKTYIGKYDVIQDNVRRSKISVIL